VFSGAYPFHDIPNDYQFMVTLQQGRRPSRPLHDLSRFRGLNDEIWELIESSWATEPSARLSASQIVDRLLAMPNRAADQRPADNFDISLPSKALRYQDNLPFAQGSMGS
jgi:hypothetical protein